jgi:hypothetical protein
MQLHAAALLYDVSRHLLLSVVLVVLLHCCLAAC